MRLNLHRVEGAAQRESRDTLNDSRSDPCLAPFERTNSGLWDTSYDTAYTAVC